MTKKKRARHPDRPLVPAILAQTGANPELAHALGLEANALDSVDPEVADRLNPCLEKPRPSCAPLRTLSPFNIVEHLHTAEDTEAYLQACIEEDPGDGSLIKRAKEEIARASIRLNAKQ